MEKGEPGAYPNAPLSSTVRTATLPCAGFATKRKLPLGEITIDPGLAAAGGAGGVATTGNAGTSRFRLPLPGSTVNEVIVPAVWFATKRNEPTGDMTTAIGPAPVLNILIGFTGTTTLLLTGTESWPLPELISSRVRLSPAKLHT